MLWGYSPTLSVFWSTVLTFGAELPHPRDRAHAEAAGARRWPTARSSVLTAATTCATAGIIVGVVTLTGLGLNSRRS